MSIVFVARLIVAGGDNERWRYYGRFKTINIFHFFSFSWKMCMSVLLDLWWPKSEGSDISKYNYIITNQINIGKFYWNYFEQNFIRINSYILNIFSRMSFKEDIWRKLILLTLFSKLGPNPARYWVPKICVLLSTTWKIK